MIKFIFRDSRENKIIHSDIIVNFSINSYFESDNNNHEVLHLIIKTKSRQFTFRVCADDRQGWDLDKIKDRILKHYNNCFNLNLEYQISDFSQRTYIFIGDSNDDEYYYQQYTGNLLKN